MSNLAGPGLSFFNPLTLSAKDKFSMAPMKFFLERQRGAHHLDRIYFMTHCERSLSVADAVELVAQLAFLIEDDKAIGVRLAELRGEGKTAEKETEVIHLSDAPAQKSGDSLSDMTKAEQKDELGGMSKAQLLDAASQHDAAATSSMNKGELVSSLKKKLKSDEASA
jgi:hypothetical protein